MSAGNSRFPQVMEGDEVERFLKAFVLPEDVRQGMGPAGSSYPKSTDDVLSDVKAIWKEKGFLSPAELRTELISKYIPNSDPSLKKFIADTELSRNAPETTTGYLSKEHAYITTGLAHLYAVETGRPIAMAEVDFSNMGGTNKEFERRIAAERNVPLESVNSKEAERMTDQAVRLLSDGMTKSLGNALPDGAKIVPIRTGGDELRLIFTGVDDPQKLADISRAMHARIEHHVAGMGLQDHPHLKDPKNPARNGFGAALTIQDMRHISDPSTVVQYLDERIKMEKEEIGNRRIGKVNPEVIASRLEQSLQSGRVQLPEGLEKEQFIAQQIEEEARLSKAVSDSLHKKNPLHNPELAGGIAGFQAYLEKAGADMGPSPLVSRPLPHAVANDNFASENRPGHLAAMSSLSDRRNAAADGHFKSQGVELSSADKFFLGQSINHLTPVDPSAQVMMPKDLIRQTEIYAKEAEEYRKKFDPQNPDVQDGLKKAGLSSVDDISPRVMAVSFHNLAGLNNALGHHNADLALRHFGTGIIEDSLKKSGFESEGKKPYAIAHHGGGNFSVLIDPAVVGADGKPNFISPDKIAEIDKEISRKVGEMNQMRVDEFLESRGVAVDGAMREGLAKSGVSTFSTIKDPKDRAHSTDQDIKGRVNGIHVASASDVAYSGLKDLSGDEVVARVRSQADNNLNNIRDQKIVSQNADMKASLETARTLLTEARDNPRMDMSWNERVADMLQGWRDNPDSKPPLREIVKVAAEVHGGGQLDQNSMEFKRMQMVADIVDKPQSPAYHGQDHTRDVTFLTSALAIRDAKSEPMSQKLFINTVTTASMHDFDHDGKGNGHGASYQPFRLEHQSVDNVGKLLPPEMKDASFMQMRDAVAFTDFSKPEMKPELESPASLLRKIVTRDDEGRRDAVSKTNVAVDQLSPNGFDADKFAKSDTARMAKLVAEGDLMPSAGLTSSYALRMTELLSIENPAIKAGPQSANGFLKFGCAGMFVSDAAKEMIVPSYEKNLAVTADLANKEARKIQPEDLHTLKKAGHWVMGVSDQSNGGFKPVVTLSLDGKTPEEVSQIQKVLSKFADPESGTRVINGATEKGLVHPINGSRNTISIEGGVGLKGIEDIMKVGDTLKASGAGHYEWNDDVRNWKNNTLGNVITDVDPPKVSANTSKPVSAAPQVETSKQDVPKPKVDAVKVEVSVADSSPKAAKMEGHGRAAGSGVGVGMGVYGLSQKLGENGTAKADLENKETRNLAKAGIAADAAAIAVDGADGLSTLKNASKGLQTASKISRVAAPVGVALSVASGAVDYQIAAKQGNGARAAEAVGGTAGGVAGAAAGGIVGAKAGAAVGAGIGAFFGGVGAVPGAAIGGFVGGVAGAIGGAFAGAEAGKVVADKTLKEPLQKKFDEEKKARSTEIAEKKSTPTKTASVEAAPKAEPVSQPKFERPSLSEQKISERKATPKVSQPDPDVRENKFAANAPDLGKEFKSSVDAKTQVAAVDAEAANDQKIKADRVVNNKVLLTNTM